MKPNRYVIDGAPWAGKTTLLFGDNTRPPCFFDYGFEIIPEAITRVACEMRSEGLVPTENIYEFVNRTIKLAIADLENDSDSVLFIERGLPWYFFMEDIFKIKLPKNYYDSFKLAQYTSPIFILETIYDFDMTENNKSLRKGRVATIEQRRNIFLKTIKIYQNIGFKTKIVPLFSKNIYENNSRRLDFILNSI